MAAKEVSSSGGVGFQVSSIDVSTVPGLIYLRRQQWQRAKGQRAPGIIILIGVLRPLLTHETETHLANFMTGKLDFRDRHDERVTFELRVCRRRSGIRV